MDRGLLVSSVMSTDVTSVENSCFFCVADHRLFDHGRRPSPHSLHFHSGWYTFLAGCALTYFTFEFILRLSPHFGGSFSFKSLWHPLFLYMKTLPRASPHAHKTYHLARSFLGIPRHTKFEALGVVYIRFLARNHVLHD